MSSLLLRRTAWRDRSERFGVLLGATLATFVYFSFTTLTTIGDGDFTAAGNLGHTLAVTEGPFEQIYLVTIVSLPVGNLGRGRGAQT